MHNEVLDTRIQKLTIKIQDELWFCSEALVGIRHTSDMTSIKSLSTNTFRFSAKDTKTSSQEVGLRVRS